MADWSKTTYEDIYVGNTVDIDGVIEQVTEKYRGPRGELVLYLRGKGSVAVDADRQIEVFR